MVLKPKTAGVHHTHAWGGSISVHVLMKAALV